MAFIKKIKAESPDPALKQAARKQQYGQAQLARLAHVNELGKETEEGLQLCGSQVTTSEVSGNLPTVLQKTATRIEYADGVVLEGWQLITFGYLDGTSNTFSNITSINIDEVPGEGNQGYYMPYKITGVVKARDTTLGEVITQFQNGAEFTDVTPASPTFGETVQCDSLSVIQNTAGATVDFEVTGLANTANAEAEIFTQFEFLCYEGVIPTII